MTPQLKPQQSFELPEMDEMVNVTMTVPRRDVQTMLAWMTSDTWEKARQLRSEEHEQYIASLEHCVDMAANHDHGGARVMAHFLGSLYNGKRVKADVSDIGVLDMANFEHLMNVLRLCHETHSEPHSFFANGNELFEHIIKVWRLENRRRS